MPEPDAILHAHWNTDADLDSHARTIRHAHLIPDGEYHSVPYALAHPEPVRVPYAELHPNTHPDGNADACPDCHPDPDAS